MTEACFSRCWCCRMYAIKPAVHTRLMKVPTACESIVPLLIQPKTKQASMRATKLRAHRIRQTTRRHDRAVSSTVTEDNCSVAERNELPLTSLKEGDSYEGGYAALSVGSCC